MRIRRVKFFVAAGLLAIMLAGCNGDAPILTCRDPCGSSSNHRNLFCDCVPNNSPGLPPAPPVETVLFSYTSEDTGNCNANPHYFVRNGKSVPIFAKYQRCNPAGDPSCKVEVFWTDKVQPGATYYVGYGEAEPSCKDTGLHALTYVLAGRTLTARNGAEAELTPDLEDFFNLRARLRALESRRKQGAGLDIGDGHVLKSFPRASDRVPRTSVDAGYVQSLGIRARRLQSKAPLNCEAECKDGSGLTCLALDDFEGAQAGLAYNAIASLKPGDTVPIALVNNIFNLQGDVCGREDVRVSDQGRTFQKGEHCTYPVRITAAANPFLAFTVPSYVSGDGAFDAGAQSIDFNSMVESPWATFRKWELDDALGGQVYRVEAKNGFLFYQLGSACMRLPVSPVRRK